MTTSKKLKWDPLTDTWYGEGVPPQTGYERHKRNESLKIGDAFAGGIILGICTSGVLWSLVMALAFQ
jgi:hypothetical protein